jgi:hypothetical protein
MPSTPQSSSAQLRSTNVSSPVASSAAAETAKRRNAISFRLPLFGAVSLPSSPHLAWYAGVAALGAAGVVEFPVAVLLAAGKALSDDRSNKTLQDFGDALEEAG